MSSPFLSQVIVTKTYRMATLALTATVLAALLALSGCSNAGTPAATSSPRSTVTALPSAVPTSAAATATPTRTAPARTTPTVSPSPTPTRGPATEITVEVVAKELNVPWSLAFAPDGRLFVTERGGTIRTIRDGVFQREPFAQLPVAAEGEGGLLGLALDPDFGASRHLYVYYTYRDDGGRLLNRVVRLTDREGKGQEPVVLLDGIPGGRIHDGGRIKFGPDGKLYIATGETGISSLAQDRTSLAGKILRINADGSIPAENPFPGSPVYSYGHRNPQGLAWHPVTGALFAAEHGPSAHDEINLIKVGNNYGWPAVVGGAADPRFKAPVLESDLDTWAPSGVTFYSGDQLPPAWQGRLLVANLRGQQILWVKMKAPDYMEVEEKGVLFARRYGRIRDVVQGPDGYLYFATNNLDGRGNPREGDDLILRIVPVRGPLGFHPGN